MAEFFQREARVLEDWIDYNGHMNVAYYVLVFDHSTDGLLDKLGLGTTYREAENNSFFVVESHVTYDREVKKDDLLVVKTKLLGYDTKRLHVFHEMFEGASGEKCATNEIMLLHVDMDERKTKAMSERFSNDLSAAIECSLVDGFPTSCGRSIVKLLSNK